MKRITANARKALIGRRNAPLQTPTDLNPRGAADVFALYLNAKHFHRQMSGPQVRDHHLHLA